MWWMVPSMSVRVQLWMVLIITLLVLRNPHKVAVKWVRELTQRQATKHIRHVSAEEFRAATTHQEVPSDEGLLLHSLAPQADDELYDGPSLIRGTSLKTRLAVKRFQSHLSCFSKSGKWTIDPKPAFCKVDTTPHPYCNNSSATRVVGSTKIAELQGHNLGRHNVSWVWKTNASCPLVSSDRVEVCKLLASKGNILILGDSINYQIFTTFLNFLRANYSHHVHSDHGFGREEICGDIVPDRKTTIGWVWNPFLELNGTVPYLEEWNIKTLLFNTGAKYRADTDYTTSIQRFVDVLQARYRHILVIFRNTPPGHIGCQYFHEPIGIRQDKAELIYHWGEFTQQNQLAKAIIEQARYIYMDVDTMLSMRPDQHMKPPKDCLHYAIPGPLDVVFHLFYNILLLFQYKFFLSYSKHDAKCSHASHVDKPTSLLKAINPLPISVPRLAGGSP